MVVCLCAEGGAWEGGNLPAPPGLFKESGNENGRCVISRVNVGAACGNRTAGRTSIDSSRCAYKRLIREPCRTLAYVFSELQSTATLKARWSFLSSYGPADTRYRNGSAGNGGGERKRLNDTDNPRVTAEARP